MRRPAKPAAYMAPRKRRAMRSTLRDLERKLRRYPEFDLYCKLIYWHRMDVLKNLMPEI